MRGEIERGEDSDLGIATRTPPRKFASRIRGRVLLAAFAVALASCSTVQPTVVAMQNDAGFTLDQWNFAVQSRGDGRQVCVISRGSKTVSLIIASSGSRSGISGVSAGWRFASKSANVRFRAGKTNHAFRVDYSTNSFNGFVPNAQIVPVLDAIASSGVPNLEIRDDQNRMLAELPIRGLRPVIDRWKDCLRRIG